MDNFIFYKIGMVGKGLTNQIGGFVSCIIDGIVRKKSYLVIDNFSIDYQDCIRIPMSDVIDIDDLNEKLKEMRIRLLDMNYVNIEIEKVTYGRDIKKIDLTEKIKNGQVCLKKGVNLNLIAGDPAPREHKFLFIRYKVNNWTEYNVYPEYIPFDIIFDINKLDKIDMGRWINTLDIEMYDKILRMIKFNDKYKNLANSIIDNIVLTEKVNAIHIRDEEDALQFWSKINGIPKNFFLDKLTERYINLIKDNFSKEDSILVISGNPQSQVLNFLSSQGYKFHLCPKNLIKGRELTALVDMFFSFHANNTFISSFDLSTYTGSTFSYMLYKLNQKYKKCICIDMDNIFKQSTVFEN